MSRKAFQVTFGVLAFLAIAPLTHHVVRTYELGGQLLYFSALCFFGAATHKWVFLPLRTRLTKSGDELGSQGNKRSRAES